MPTAAKDKTVPEREDILQNNAMEVYGFVLWIASFVCYVLFVCWALVPADVIESIGITYYPSKVWANAAPAFFCITAAYALTLFFFANLYITNPLSSVRTYKDGAAQLQTRPILRQNKYAVDDIYDIPIDIVNKCLY